jgi:murein DD-endopeptidase MepM/ murein hydrolase activator NlpD
MPIPITKRLIRFASILFLFIAMGFAIPESARLPVVGATIHDWNHDTFWFEPWGASGVHKGIDIFAATGTSVLATETGLILYTGQLKLGGNVALLLGPKWRIHYYAHLQQITTSTFSWVQSGDRIGVVGKTGNAQTRPPHLHYSILSIFPRLWRIDSSTQGWKKAFYINPDAYLRR